MAITPLKALLFVAGGSVAAAGTAYVSGALDPYFNETPPAAIANVPPAAGADATAPADNAMKPAAPADNAMAPAPADNAMKPADTAMAPAPEDNAMKPADTAMAPAPEDNAMKPAAPADNAMAPAAPADNAMKPAAPAEAATGPALPTFDVVRVEDNGSIVVAGNAAPNAKVEILNGSTVLGSTTAGADGAFVIVLDDPLKPGDYQITLRSTVPPSDVLTSAQTAVVSIPDKVGGQVLAMVEEPGKPAELLTLPTPEKQPEASADQAAATPPAAEAPATAAPAATDEAAKPADQAAAPAEAKTEPAAPAAAATEAAVVVKAVEIDGGKIFVAGTADPGRKVRAYANEDALGDAVTSPDGNFLVEAAKDLAVGDYTIRVDALDADGVKVIARASVPFQREPGEAIAAVAPDQPKTDEPKPAEAAAAAEQPAAPATTQPAIPPATEAAKPAEPATVAEQPAAPASGEPAAVQPAEVAAATPPAVPETTAPKLEQVDGAVIIKRGDSLWRISRKVYGRGVRYSTIYLANQQQIGDPNRIWPGQVFKVPEKSDDGQPADMTKVGEQATTVPAAGTDQAKTEQKTQ